MKVYRLYVMGKDRVSEVRVLNAADDDAAIEQATRSADGRAMVLWEGLHKIKEFPESGDAPPEAT